MLKQTAFLILILVLACVITIDSYKFKKKLISVNIHDRSLNCVLEFYKKYSQSDQNVPGSLINFSLAKQSEFQSIFLKKISDLKENYYNSTLRIQMTNQYKMQPFQMMPKVSKYITIIANAREINDNILSWKNSSSWNQLATVFVILRAALLKSQKSIAIQRIFKSLHEYDFWRSYVFYIDVIDETVSSVIWYPTLDDGPEQINDIKLIELERCNFNANLTNEMHKPFSCINSSFISQINSKRLLTNLDLRPLKVSARIFPPYVMYVNNTIDGEIFSGVEIFLVKLIVSKLNMSLIIDILVDKRDPLENR